MSNCSKFFCIFALIFLVAAMNKQRNLQDTNDDSNSQDPSTSVDSTNAGDGSTVAGDADAGDGSTDVGDDLTDAGDGSADAGDGSADAGDTEDDLTDAGDDSTTNDDPNNTDSSNDSSSPNSSNSNSDPEIVLDSNSVQNSSNITLNTTLMNLNDQQNISADNCHQYIINKQYQAVNLELTNLQNVDHILVAEQEADFNGCNPNSFKACSNNTLFCIYEDGIQNEVDLKIQHCSSMLYLYIYINNTNLSDPNSYGQIQVEEEDDDEICSEIEPEDWDYCSSLTLDNCSSNNISVCDESCKWVQCNFVSSTGSNNFSMCVPDDLPASNQTNDICMTNIDFNQSSSKYVNYKYCGLALNADVTVFTRVRKSVSVLFIAFVILVLVLILFFGSVCWYRWKLNNSKVPPFTPPACCPEFLFPRPPVIYDEHQPEIVEIADTEYHEIKENK